MQKKCKLSCFSGFTFQSPGFGDYSSGLAVYGVHGYGLELGSIGFRVCVSGSGPLQEFTIMTGYGLGVRGLTACKIPSFSHFRSLTMFCKCLESLTISGVMWVPLRFKDNERDCGGKVDREALQIEVLGV